MYNRIYHWNVDKALTESKKVYCLNMETNTVSCLNELMVNSYINLKNDAIIDDEKYVFYYKEQEGENNV